MARTRKSTQLLNLKKYDVLIEDKNKNSEYFKISQFDGYFYGGRNSFLIAGASVLAPNTKILVEILNKDGQTIYSSPIASFVEGSSRLVQIEVYSDTPIGPGKIVILGSADSYIDGTPIPAEWKGKYNVRWVADVIISPLIENKTPIRFQTTPDATVTERIYASTSESAYIQKISVPANLQFTSKYFNVFNNGYLTKFNDTSSSKFLSKYLGGIISGSVNFESGGKPYTASISIPITKIFNSTLAESDGSSITMSDGSIFVQGFVSSSGSYITELQPFGFVTASSTLNIIYDELIAGTTGSNISFADIRVSNAATLSGEIHSVEVSVKSEADPGEFTSLGTIRVGVNELLSADINSAPVNVGYFSNNINIPSYWYAATMSVNRNEIVNSIANQYVSNNLAVPTSLSILKTDSILIDSIAAIPEVVNNNFINDVAYFIGTTDELAISLFPRTEYTLAFDAIVSKYSSSVELLQDDYSLQVYLVPLSGSGALLTPDDRGQLIGTLTPQNSFVKQNFDRVELNFTPQTLLSGKFGLRFVAYGGIWHIADISLKAAEEPLFSPDEINILLPILHYDNTVLTFQVHYLDVNNNSTGIYTTTTPRYFQGTRKFVKRVGDEMTGELFIKGLPIQQQALQDAFTGLIDGGIININTPASWSYNISSGSGYVIDNYNDPARPEYRLVSWSQINKVPDAFITTGSLAAYPRTNIAISASGQVIEQSAEWTPLDYRKYIILGRVAHVGTPFIQRALSLPLTTYNRGFHWFDLANAIGIINAEGNVYYPSGSSMQIGKTEGKTYRVGSNYRNNTAYPDITSDPASLPTQFAYRYRSGSGFAETPVTTVITGSLYDNGSGILQTVTPNKFTIQRIYYFGATNTTRIQFGQTVYGTLRDAAAAIGSEVFVADPNLTRDSSLRAYLIVGSSTTNLSDISQAEFVSTGKFGTGGGGGGGGGAANLSELNDVSFNGLSAGQLLQYNGTTWGNGINVNALATTGSNNFVGNQVITGSLFISGSSTLTNIGPAIFSGSLNVTDGITGTLQTAAQPNVTSVGALSSLTVNGNVGIGTTSPTKKLHVVGGGLFSGSAASTDLKLSDSATNTDLHMFFQNADIAQIASFNKTLAAGSKTLWITSDVLTLNTFNGSSYSTRWQINSAGHLLAGSDNTYDIGANGSNRPRNLFLAGSVTAASVTASLFGTSSVATSASYVEYVNVGNTPSLVSASSQVSYTGLSDIPSDIVSSSVQATTWTVATASFATTASFASSTLFNARGFSLYAPTDAENMTLFYTNVSLTLASITSVLRADVSPTPSVSYTVRYGSDRSATGTSVTSASISTSNRTTGQTNTAFSNGTIPANNFIWLTTSAVSGVVEELSVTLRFT